MILLFLIFIRIFNKSTNTYYCIAITRSLIRQLMQRHSHYTRKYDQRNDKSTYARIPKYTHLRTAVASSVHAWICAPPQQCNSTVMQHHGNATPQQRNTTVMQHNINGSRNIKEVVPPTRIELVSQPWKGRVLTSRLWGQPYHKRARLTPTRHVLCFILACAYCKRTCFNQPLYYYKHSSVWQYILQKFSFFCWNYLQAHSYTLKNSTFTLWYSSWKLVDTQTPP